MFFEQIYYFIKVKANYGFIFSFYSAKAAAWCVQYPGQAS